MSKSYLWTFLCQLQIKMPNVGAKKHLFHESSPPLCFVSPNIRRLSGGPGQSAVKCNQLSKADPKLADLMIFQLPLKRGITSLSIYWLVVTQH